MNGAIYQVMLGLTQAGTSETDTTAITTVRNASFSGNCCGAGQLDWRFCGGATDAWGTTTNLATNYDLTNGFLPWGATTGWNYFGNGSNAVFSGATSGTDYLRLLPGHCLAHGYVGSGN